MADFPRDIVLENGRYSIPIWIRNNLKGIQEISQSPSSIFAAGGGPQKYGDAEPGFAFMEQRTWEGGRGLDFFSDDPTRYFDSKGAWTLTPGKVGPAPQWFMSRGHRPNLAEFVLPGDVTWRPLYDDTQYVDRKITPTATITSDKVAMWVRRVGNPSGDLTVEICSDSSGSPNTVLQTATVDSDTITDFLSVFYEFNWSGTQSLTGGTSYHIKIYGGGDDTRDGHWEVGVDAGTSDGLYSSDGSSWSIAAYSLYYYLTGTDINAHLVPFVMDEVLYWVSIYHDGTASRVWMVGRRGIATAASATTLTDSAQAYGTSSEFVGAWVKIIRGKGFGQTRQIISHTNTALTVATWDITPDTTSVFIIYATPRLIECATTGLGVVTDVAVQNNVAFFAQGEAVNIRMMRWDSATPGHTYVDDGTNKATLLAAGYMSSVPGAVMWRANNDATVAGAHTVSRANAIAYAGTHSFGTAVKAGDGNFPITNIIDGANSNTNSRLFVFKTGENGFIEADKWYRDNVDIGAFPEFTNGLAAKVHGLYKFFNWSWSLERQYGDALDDLDPNRDAGFPAGRQGYISAIESHPVGVLVAIDGGDTGISSVQFFDGVNYHEIFRAPKAGKRIRALIWQPNQDTKKFLWINCGDDLIYMEFPQHHRDPYKDATQNFMHEFSIVSATFDMGNSAIYKVWKDIRLVTKNLDGANGIKLRLDYQVDNDIGTDTWTQVDFATVSSSPAQTVTMYVGESQQFRYRIRGYTTDATIPPVLNGVVVKGVGQLPIKYVDSFWGNFGPVAQTLGAANEDAIDIITEAARTATVWTIQDCIFKRAVGRKVLAQISQINPSYTTDGRDNFQAQITLIGLDD